jgi:hypothetical protein
MQISTWQKVFFDFSCPELDPDRLEEKLVGQIQQSSDFRRPVEVAAAGGGELEGGALRGHGALHGAVGQSSEAENLIKIWCNLTSSTDTSSTDTS